MTTTERPVTRETFARMRGRPLVIRLDRHAIFIREKGRRFGYAVDYESIYTTGAKIADRQRRIEKQQAKRKGKSWPILQ